MKVIGECVYNGETYISIEQINYDNLCVGCCFCGPQIENGCTRPDVSPGHMLYTCTLEDLRDIIFIKLGKRR